LVRKKLEWWIYQTVKKFEIMSTRFDTIHERDRRTDGHRATAYAALWTASHSKNQMPGNMLRATNYCISQYVYIYIFNYVVNEL